MHKLLKCYSKKSSNTSDLVNILKWETKGFVCGTFWWGDQVKSFDQGLSGNLLVLSFNTFPSLVPRHVGGCFHHVVTNPTGDRNEWDTLGVVSDLLQVC